MQTVKTLAPTIIAALIAVEKGIRQIQTDDHFMVDTSSWLEIREHNCYGCVATTTLMQLTNNTSETLLQHFGTATEDYIVTTALARAHAFGIVAENDSQLKEFADFESCIDSLRCRSLSQLLEFYGLQHHTNNYEATLWLYDNQPNKIQMDADETILLRFADFIKTELIPRVEKWFPVTN